MKKIRYLLIICLLVISSDFYGQVCDDTTINVIIDVVSGETDVQHAETDLTAINTIFSGGGAHYKAGTNVKLNAGFKVELGGEFKAEIEDCLTFLGTPFVTKWHTDTPGETVTIPTFPNMVYNYQIDWNYDGVTFDVEETATGNATHPYDIPGDHTIAIRGLFPRIYFLQYNPFRIPDPNNEKIIEVIQWGSNVWESMEGAFTFCSELIITAADNPKLDMVESMELMFYGCTSLDGHSMDDWEVDNVKVMRSLFAYSSYNVPLDNWVVSEVTDMSNMFEHSPFSHSLGSWDVSKVSTMSGMLNNCGMNQFNYESTLNGWANLYDPISGTGLIDDVKLGAAGRVYCDETGRDILIDSFNGPNWDIQGDMPSSFCGNSSQTESIQIEETQETESSIKIYPNPVKDELSISGLRGNKNSEIFVFDVSGRVLLSVIDESNIDVSELKSGVYFIQILGEKKITKKFIKL